MGYKKWYQSKMLWANIIAIVAVVLTGRGIEIDAETQAVMATTVLAVVNIILRCVTNKGIVK